MLGARLMSAAGWQGAPAFCASPLAAPGAATGPVVTPRPLRGGELVLTGGGLHSGHASAPTRRCRASGPRPSQGRSHPPSCPHVSHAPVPLRGPCRSRHCHPDRQTPGQHRARWHVPSGTGPGGRRVPRTKRRSVASTPDAALAGDARHSPACASSVGIRTRRLQGDHPHPAPDEAQGLPGSRGRVRASERHREPTRADRPAQRGRSRPLPPPQAAGKSEMGPGGSLAGLVGRI